MTKMTFGNAVRKRREELGLTRERLALSLNVSTSLITRLELDDKLPRGETLIRVARELGISLDDELLDAEEASA